MDERDFKGIWIPKNVWFDDKLSALDKMILAEIDSLDCGDKHCRASNEYIAKFCQCSESQVTKSITLLKSLNYIEQVSFDGRTRILRSLINFTTQTNKIYEADSQILGPDNISICKHIDNKINDNNIISSKEEICVSNNKKCLLDLKTQQPKPKKEKIDKSKILADNVKKSLYKKISNIKIIDLLSKWIDELYDKGKGISSNALDIALEQLDKVPDEQKEEVIKKATLNGWRDFSFCSNQNKSQGKFRLDQNVITDTAAREESLKEFRLKQQQGGTEGVDYY